MISLGTFLIIKEHSMYLWNSGIDLIRNCFDKIIFCV